jgi:hypothetical protein
MGGGEEAPGTVLQKIFGGIDVKTANLKRKRSQNCTEPFLIFSVILTLVDNAKKISACSVF